jgi:hypothetical protein
MADQIRRVQRSSELHWQFSVTGTSIGSPAVLGLSALSSLICQRKPESNLLHPRLSPDLPFQACHVAALQNKYSAYSEKHRKGEKNQIKGTGLIK